MGARRRLTRLAPHGNQTHAMPACPPCQVVDADYAVKRARSDAYAPGQAEALASGPPHAAHGAASLPAAGSHRQEHPRPHDAAAPHTSGTPAPQGPYMHINALLKELHSERLLRHPEWEQGGAARAATAGADQHHALTQHHAQHAPS